MNTRGEILWGVIRHDSSRQGELAFTCQFAFPEHEFERAREHVESMNRIMQHVGKDHVRFFWSCIPSLPAKVA